MEIMGYRKPPAFCNILAVLRTQLRALGLLGLAIDNYLT